MDEQPFSMELQYTAQDYHDAEPALRNYRYQVRVLLALILLLAPLIIVVLTGLPWWDLKEIAPPANFSEFMDIVYYLLATYIIFLIPLLIFIATPLLIHLGRKLKRRQWLEQLSTSPIRFEFAPEGISIRSNFLESTTSWRCFSKIIERRQSLVLRLHGLMARVIPKRGLTDEQVSLIKRWAASKEIPDTHRGEIPAESAPHDVLTLQAQYIFHDYRLLNQLHPNARRFRRATTIFILLIVADFSFEITRTLWRAHVSLFSAEGWRLSEESIIGFATILGLFAVLLYLRWWAWSEQRMLLAVPITIHIDQTGVSCISLNHKTHAIGAPYPMLLTTPE